MSGFRYNAYLAKTFGASLPIPALVFQGIRATRKVGTLGSATGRREIMFAKVFSQIFDSSIAEDYNCRRMFMDLLVLADSDGVVDMTQEAIARRTNVPLTEVCKYISELQKPDTLSRSKAEDGRRLMPVDAGRPWGWQIVNFGHYRQIRDEESRRSYFRVQKQKQRKLRGKKKNVQDKMVDTGGHVQIVASTSSSDSALGKGNAKGKPSQTEIEEFCLSASLPRSDGEATFNKWQGNGWTNRGKAIRDWQATIRSWKLQGYMPSQKPNGNGNGTKPPETPLRPGYVRDSYGKEYKDVSSPHWKTA